MEDLTPLIRLLPCLLVMQVENMWEYGPRVKVRRPHISSVLTLIYRDATDVYREARSCGTHRKYAVFASWQSQLLTEWSNYHTPATSSRFSPPSDHLLLRSFSSTGSCAMSLTPPYSQLCARSFPSHHSAGFISSYPKVHETGKPYSS